MECNNCKNQNAKSSIQKIIGVMSGKGGVGKSTVTVMLADSLLNHGYKVGIFDADISGPSIPSLLNINEKLLQGNEEEIYPYETEKGLKIVSMNLMMDDVNQPVIWRGSILSNVIQQFWKKVIWGDIDYLLIDMPPGTSDVALTVLQQIHPNTMIMVSIPQEMVQMIVHKSIEMVNKMNIKMLGLILNMSYYICPCCNEKFRLYHEKSDSVNPYRVLAELPATIDVADIANNQGILTDSLQELIDPVTHIITEEIKINTYL